MLSKMLIEIFQAIVEDPTIRKLLGNYQSGSGYKSASDLESMMDELGLNAQEREKFREAYKDYQQDPYGSYERYKYRYEPKSSDPFDKFDSYFQKFEDRAKEAEEKFGKGAGDYSHRKYSKYRYQSGGGSSSNSGPTQGSSANEAKHYKTLEVKPDSSFEEIKNAYKTAMKKYHPDRFQDDAKKKNAERLSMEINVAYDYFKKKFNKN